MGHTATRMLILSCFFVIGKLSSVWISCCHGCLQDKT